MTSLRWIDEQINFLNGRMGIYRLDAKDNFFFEPTTDFYEFLMQGTINCFNQAMRNLADFIESKTCPIIDEWKGSQNPIVMRNSDSIQDNIPPGIIHYSGSNHSRIELSIANQHSPKIMGAILAHELTHHFLDQRDIRFSDAEENEKLTDLASIFIGLGKLIINGYEAISWAQGDTRWSYKVGYLFADDIAAILFQVSALRSISLDIVKLNLSDEALKTLNKISNLCIDYTLKKELVGPRICPHCGMLSQFSFSDDDGLYCSLCRWEWSASFMNANEKRAGLRSLIRRLIRKRK